MPKDEESELEELIEELEEDEAEEDEEKVKEVSKEVVVREVKGKGGEEIKFRDEGEEADFFEPISVKSSGSSDLEMRTGSQDVGWTRDPNAREESSESTQNQSSPFSYDVNAAEEETKKYTDYSKAAEVERVDLVQAGRKVNPFEVREAGFVHSENARQDNNSKMKEEYLEPSRIDVSQAGRENVFERSNLKEAERKRDYEVK